MDRPIFIVGANRSGTTLLRLILNAHSHIAIPEEVLYFRSQIHGLSIDDWDTVSLNEQQFTAIVKDFVGRVEIPDLDKPAVTQSIMMLPRNLRSPYRGLMEYWTAAQGKVRWGEKTPGNLFYADIINEMFPDACFIHMVRDPRPGVYSMERVWFFPEDIIFNALSRHKHMTVGRQTLENAVPADRIMTLRYEDLVAEPERIVSEVCEFIGEEYEPGMMAYHRGADKHMRSDAAADFNASATKPITTGKNDSWREKMTKREVAAIELISRREMAEFNYEVETLFFGPVVRFQVMVKTAYWKLQEWKNRHNRHFTVRYKMFAGLKKRLGSDMTTEEPAIPEPS